MIVCLFKTSIILFTATSMFFCGDGHSNEDSEEECDKDSDQDSDED